MGLLDTLPDDAPVSAIKQKGSLLDSLTDEAPEAWQYAGPLSDPADGSQKQVLGISNRADQKFADDVRTAVLPIPALAVARTEKAIGGTLRGLSENKLYRNRAIQTVAPGLATIDLIADITGAKEKLEQPGRDFYEEGAAVERQVEKEKPVTPGTFPAMLRSAGTSMVQQIPGLALSVATGSPLPSLAIMSGETAGEKYGEYREKGFTPGQAAIGAGAHGAIEGATELIPGAAFLKIAGTPLIKTFGKSAGEALAAPVTKSLVEFGVGELGGEAIATLTQDIIDQAYIKPGMSSEEIKAAIADYLENKAIPAQKETAGTTAIQSVAMSTLGLALRAITGAKVKVDTGSPVNLLDGQAKPEATVPSKADVVNAIRAMRKRQPKTSLLDTLEDKDDSQVGEGIPRPVGEGQELGGAVSDQAGSGSEIETGGTLLADGATEIPAEAQAIEAATTQATEAPEALATIGGVNETANVGNEGIDGNAEVDGLGQPGQDDLSQVRMLDAGQREAVPRLRDETDVDALAHQAATSPLNDLPQPTEAQKSAGNYPKGHVKIHGLDISIENPIGSKRSGKDTAGKPWETEMKEAHYGYVKGTTGKDGDQVDIFVAPNAAESDKVFLVDQVDPKSGTFDEHKAIIGPATAEEARSTYLANYDESGRTRIGAVTEMTVDEFKGWLKEGNTKKPLSKSFASKKESTPVPQGREEMASRISAEQAYLDPLTGAYNEWFFKNSPEQGATAVWSFDSAKAFNDNVSHDFANNVFRIAGQAVVRAGQEMGIPIFKVGGNFAAHLPNTAEGQKIYEQLTARAEQLADTLEVTNDINAPKEGKKFKKGHYNAVTLRGKFGAGNYKAIDKAFSEEKQRLEAEGVKPNREVFPAGMQAGPTEARQAQHLVSPVTTEMQERFNRMSPAERFTAVYRNPVTGSLNKNALIADEKLRRENEASISADLRGLAKINKLYGEEVGDDLLRTGDSILKAIAKKIGGLEVYHVSGDEFAVRGNIKQVEEFDAFLDNLGDKTKIRNTKAGEELTVSFLNMVGETYEDADSKLSALKQRAKASVPEGGNVDAWVRRVFSEVKSGRRNGSDVRGGSDSQVQDAGTSDTVVPSTQSETKIGESSAQGAPLLSSKAANRAKLKAKRSQRAVAKTATLDSMGLQQMYEAITADFDEAAMKEYAAEALESARRIFDNPGGLGSLPNVNEYLTQRYRTLGTLSEIKDNTHDVYNIFKKASPEDAKAIYDYLTDEQGVATTIKDSALQAAAVKMKQEIMDIGENLVAYGLLDQDTFEANKGRYLPRVYLKHIIGEDMFNAIGSGKHLDLNYLKKRKDIPEDVRRLVLGEIKDPAYLLAKAVSIPSRDIALIDWLSNIAQRSEWVLPKTLVEWTMEDNPSRRVGQIEYRKNDDGTYDLTVNNVQTVETKHSNVAASNLAKIIGEQTVADYIKAGKGKEVGKTPWRRVGQFQYKTNADGTYDLKIKERVKSTAKHQSVAEADLAKTLTKSKADAIAKGEGKAVGGMRVTPFYLMSEAERIQNMLPHLPEADRKASDAISKRMREKAQEALKDIPTGNLPSDYRQMPNTSKYGALRGLVVRKEIYNDIVGNINISIGEKPILERILIGDLGQKGLGWWKWAKVAANPPAQVRNAVSNIVLLHLSGVPMYQVPHRIAQAVSEIKNNGKHWQVAKKYGVKEATFANTEMARIEQELKDLEARTAGKYSWAQFKVVWAKIVNTTGDMYQFMEAVSKTAKIIDEMENGKTAQAAAMEAHKWLFDYSLASPTVKFMRSSPIGLIPFATFMTKILPRLAEVAVKSPWRFTPYIAIAYGLQAAVAGMLDVDDDDLEALKQTLPDWIRDKQHVYILPVKDSAGRWQAVDLGYFFPWTQWTEIGEKVGKGDIYQAMKQSGLLGGPLPDLITAIKTNIDPFTQRPIVDKYGTPAEQAAQMMGYLYQMATPPFLTKRGTAGKIVSASTNQVDKFGMPKSTMGQAASSLVGVNVLGFDPAMSRAQNIKRMQFEISEVQRQGATAMKDLNLSTEDRAEVRKKYMERIQRMNRELLKYQAKSLPKDRSLLRR